MYAVVSSAARWNWGYFTGGSSPHADTQRLAAGGSDNEARPDSMFSLVLFLQQRAFPRHRGNCESTSLSSLKRIRKLNMAN